MKKILVYYSQLNIGGAEKSLIRLMNTLVEQGEDVTLLTRYGGGKAEYLLDKRVRVVSLSNKYPKSTKSVGAMFLFFICFVQRLWAIMKLHLHAPMYDIAFVGLQGLSPKLIVNHIKARKIAVFVRNDISRFSGNKRVETTIRSYLQKVDYYVCVAETVKDALVRVVPETAHKAKVIYNILNAEEMQHNILTAPNPFLKEDDNIFRIVSVCRIADSAKGVFRMVKVCKRLIEEGYHFRWYIVGDGPDLQKLKDEIEHYGLNGIMITPGRVDNPFGYYRECDLVAMLSYYEGLCGVVNEAKVVGKAIIATEVSGVREQLDHGKNGWIVENDEKSIMQGMRYLLSNPEVVRTMTNKIYPEEILDDSLKLKKILSLA